MSIFHKIIFSQQKARRYGFFFVFFCVSPESKVLRCWGGGGGFMFV